MTTSDPNVCPECGDGRAVDGVVHARRECCVDYFMGAPYGRYAERARMVAPASRPERFRRLALRTLTKRRVRLYSVAHVSVNGVLLDEVLNG